MTAKML